MQIRNVCLLVYIICVLAILTAVIIIYTSKSKSKKGKSKTKPPQIQKFVVFPILHSGLGNQLFMVAAAVAVASATNREVVIPDSSFWNPHVKQPDKYVNTIFSSFKRVDRLVDTSMYARIKYDTFAAWNPSAPPSEETTTGSGNIITDGYFQYFPAIQFIEKELISTFRKNLSLSTGDMQNAVGLHVRRGDYIASSFSITPLSYFQAAMGFIKARVHASVPFILFTDDPAWCQAQGLFSACVFNRDMDDVTCLASMASCKAGFICSNSTYSWWGAFLGAHHAGGIVCAPSKWINTEWVNPRHGTLYPPTWNIISAE